MSGLIQDTRAPTAQPLRWLKRWLRSKRQSAIPLSLMESIQKGVLAYSYKGVPALKSPFDLSLYQHLIWELRPRTIIEVGAHLGGSTLWLADAAAVAGVDCQVHAVDLKPITGVSAPNINFHVGDARALDRLFSSEFMSALAHPMLVIEDADHQAETTLAVLRFFAPWLWAGDYLVVEDGMVGDIGIGHRFGGGPCVAIKRFLTECPGRYEIDRRYCDWYGRNVTWNINGYLRRTSAL